MTDPVDILIAPNDNGIYDISWTSEGDFMMTHSLETATLMSLTCERRAKEYEITMPEYRRGWIGNLLFEDVDHEDGCGNWLYEQKRLNSKTINGIRDESEKGMLWMIQDGVAKQVNVTSGLHQMAIFVDIKIQLLDDTFYVKRLLF